MVEVQKFTKLIKFPKLEIEYETDFQSYQYDKIIDILIFQYVDI